MTEKTRVIFHSDMDRFYPAVEERERPEIRANPSLVHLIPDVEKGEVLVDSLGQGSFRR
jgi:nucleotidyltransferase/DNA polymerase involved in DNA repair